MDKPEEQKAIEPAKKRNKTIEAKFAPCLKVVLNCGIKHVMIPVDKISSDNQRAILIAKARTFVEGQLDRLAQATLTPAEVRDLVRAVSDMDALQREQYVTSLNNGAATELGRGIGSMIKQAAQGAAEGTAEAFMAKAREMDKAARKAEANSKAINV